MTLTQAPPQWRRVIDSLRRLTSRMPTVAAPPTTDLSGRSALVILAALVVASFAIRMWLLETGISAPHFDPPDPDGYMRGGRLLVRDGDDWRWTLEAIRYRWDGQIYLLPPLYPLFLSLFVRFSDAYVHSALVAQVALNALSVAGLYTIAATLHSRRAGLVAAFIYAFWITNIWTWPLFMQEQIYVPLLIVAFALLLRATARAASPAAFACAGAALGLAAMTRSMPLYYVALFAMGYPLIPRYDWQRTLRAGALVVGFLLVTGPYSVWLSQRVNKFAFIENHGGISVHLYGGERSVGIPDSGEITRQLFGAFANEPRRFLHTWSGFALALFHVHGDRWLQGYDASSAEAAARAKFIAHAGIDLPFVATVVLAPLGAVLARRSREAILLLGWIFLVVVLTALSATGGVRFRSPFEPHLIALASVVFAGHWRHPGRMALFAGILTAVAAGTILAAQLPRVARAKANYGTHEWSETEAGRRTWGRGSLGVNLLPRGGVLQIRVHSLEPASPGQPVQVSVRVNGHLLDTRLMSGSEPVDLRVLQRHAGLQYVEVRATGAGKPAWIAIEVVRGS